MKKEHSHIKKLPNLFGGFALVEMLVSMTVFLIFVSVISTGLSPVFKHLHFAVNTTRAGALIDEGIEATRNIRDADFSNLVDGTYGLTTTGGEWDLSGSSDTTGIFTRAVSISTINANQKQIDATVTWADQISPVNTISMSTYLTNWRAIINTGLGFTVNKTVINHGGSKGVTDFSPYKVGTTTVSPGAVNIFPAGTYAVTENTDSNYNQTFSGDCNTNGSIVIATNSTNACLITNEEKPSQLKVTKVVINHGGTKTAADFTLTVDGSTVLSGVTNSFDSGTHMVSEVPDAQYTKTVSGDCAANGSVILSPETTKNCTVTNEQIVVIPSITTTSPATNITQTTATGGGNVTADGGASVTARGVVWSTAINPTIALATKTNNGTGIGSFSSNITSLICNTLYHVRAYATNIAGTSYGSDVTFTTSACSVVPTIDTLVSSNILSTSATLGATVESLGIPATISARGVCYSTSLNPSLTSGATCVAGTLSQTVPSAFTISVTSLITNTIYHYRGYATNSTGTGYTADATFTPASTITFVAATSASGVSVTIPTHNVGDLLVIYAYRDGNNAAPTVPTGSGWTSIATTGGANNNSSALAYKIATGGDVSGTWTNATQVIVHVYRGVAASPIGANAFQSGNSNTVTYSALTMSVTNSSSWVVGFGGDRGTNTNVQNPPIGMINRTVILDTLSEVAGHDTNTGVSLWGAQNVSVVAKNAWMTRVLEIKSR